VVKNDGAQALGLTTTVAEVLYRRGYGDDGSTRRFLAPRLANLTTPEAMVDRQLAAERLAEAVRRGDRICVFGDYDCDGITATAILTEVLRALGGEVVPVLGSRFDGGYGVSSDAVRRIVSTEARLAVTCDCGSSDHASLRALRGQGVEAIVVDHHVVPDEPLPALAFMNPRRKDCGFPYKHLASCGLVLSLAAAVRAALGKELDIREWLDLVAVGTIADVAPLDGDNRILVRAGLQALSRAPRPGIRALLHAARVDVQTGLSAQDVAFRLAPRLNAPGRLGSPDPALALLLARDSEQANVLAERVEQLQAQRRQVQDRMLAEALEEIEQHRWHERSAIVIGRQGWNHGIVGIVAGKLVRRYERPVVVIGIDGTVGRGSARAPRGARLYDALEAANGMLARFGGHQAAAGLEVNVEHIDPFRAAFERVCAAQASAPSPPPNGDTIVELDADDDPARVLDDLALLEPCGESNPAPKLAVTARVGSARKVRGGHLKLELELASGALISGFGPAMGDRVEGLRGTLTAVGRLRRDSWRGGRAVELVVEALAS